jgi:hypothetical protein
MDDLKYIGKRISVKKGEHEVSFVISASENEKEAIPVLLWTALWSFCGIFLISRYSSDLLDKEKIFLIGFAAFWIYYEYRSTMLYLWKKQGKEIIRIEGERMTIARKTLSIPKPEVYSFEGIKEMAFMEEDVSSPLSIFSGIDFLGRKYSIRFQYFGKEVRMGYNLKKEDAEPLLKEIRKAMKGKLN